MRTRQLHRIKNKKGSSLLDVLVATALLLIVFLGIFGAFKLAFELVLTTKSKTGARAVATEQMEYVRSLSYDDVGTVGGIPSGLVNAASDETFNGIDYTIRTFIQYVDAEEDGLDTADENSITTDYKVVKVTLEWDFRGETRSLFLVSNFSPDSIESTSGGGTLNITVLDATAVAVASAEVAVVNDTVSPSVSLSTFTNASGEVSFPGATAGTGYEITVTKTGHSSSQTYDVTASNTDPNPGHLTVVASQTTSSTFQIDETGSLIFESIEYGSTTPITNIDFSIQGETTIGTDSSLNPIYKYDTTFNTGSGGSVTLDDLEWDNYTISIDDDLEGYDIAEICSIAQPIDLSPAESKTVQVYLNANTAHTLLVTATDSGSSILSGASIRLYRTGYDTTKESSSCGQTFFDSLSESTEYAVDVSLSGYTSQTISSVEVSDDTTLTVVLNSI